jgi:AcrR family transcriptional regulator
MPQAARSGSDSLAQIVAAARDCFAHLGVHRTRMEDVAAAVGTVRTSLYRRVSSRDELVELALLERCREFSVELRAGTNLGADDLRKQLVDLVIRSIAIGRGDEEFTYLVEALPRRLGSFLTGPGSPMHQIVFDTFVPLIVQGRERSVIREDASDHDIVEWIQGIITLFAPRDDLSDFEERRRIRTFLVPAVFTQAAPTGRAQPEVIP